MLVAFCVGYIQSAVSLIEQKTPIAIFKTLARLVIVNALVVRGTDIILMPMFSVVRSLTSRLIEAMGGQAGLLPNIDESSPGGVAGAIGELLSINILTGIIYCGHYQRSGFAADGVRAFSQSLCLYVDSAGSVGVFCRWKCNRHVWPQLYKKRVRRLHGSRYDGNRHTAVLRDSG